MIANLRILPFALITTGRPSTLEEIVDKNHVVTNKAIGANGHQLTDKTVRLNFSAVTNLHVFLDFCKRTNKALVPNRTAVQIYRHYNLYPTAKLHILPDARLKNLRLLTRHD